MFSAKDTWEQTGTQIQGSMKDNMTETLAVDLKGLNVTSTLTASKSAHSMRAHNPLRTHTHMLCHNWGPKRVSSNAVKNIYTLLHQRRQTNELLTDEHTHTQTIYCTLECTHSLHNRRDQPPRDNQCACFLFVCVCKCVHACAGLTVCTQVIIRGLVCAHQSVRLQSEESA